MSENNVLSSIENALNQFSDSFFSLKSLTVLVICLILAVILGKLISYLITKIIKKIAYRADSAVVAVKAYKYRRLETVLVLSTAVIRVALIILATYFWWLYMHPSQQPTAIIGASAIFIVIASATLGPILRDISSGSVMMAEQWYGIGDFVTFDPFIDLKGVVEQVSLRSTKVRGLNGEIIWLSNQHIQAVRIAPKGVRTIAIDFFVSDLRLGRKLVSEVSKKLPQGKLMLAAPLKVSETEKLGENMWRITAIGQTAPGREWLLEKFAIEMLKESDESSKKPTIVHGPITRYADPKAEQRFARAVRST